VVTHRKVYKLFLLLFIMVNKENTAYAILGRVVKNLNSQGRNLVLRDEHDKDYFIAIRVRESDAYRIGSVPIWPKKGEVVCEVMPAQGGIDWANLGIHQTIDTLKDYTSDFDLKEGLETERSRLIASLATA